MSDWLMEYIEKELAELKDFVPPKHWFSVQAISDVPYIEYQGFTKKECKEIREKLRDVLRISRNENNYEEVSITYRTDMEGKDKYAVVKGGVSSVGIGLNPIKKADADNCLVVISMHNHPNNTGLSLQDIMMFCAHSSIRLMAVVNGKGQVTYLQRPKSIDLDDIPLRNLMKICDDFLKRLQQWRKENEGKGLQIREILQDDEKMRLAAKDILYDISERGVLYKGYTEEKAKKLERPKERDEEQEVSDEEGQKDSDEEKQDIMSDMFNLEEEIYGID